MDPPREARARRKQKEEIDLEMAAEQTKNENAQRIAPGFFGRFSVGIFFGLLLGIIGFLATWFQLPVVWVLGLALAVFAYVAYVTWPKKEFGVVSGMIFGSGAVVFGVFCLLYWLYVKISEFLIYMDAGR